MKNDIIFKLRNISSELEGKLGIKKIALCGSYAMDEANDDNLQHNYISWDSIIREFEIIGEATNKLIKKEILDNESRVVVNFRNLLIHNYFGKDLEEVWDVIQNDLKGLKEIVIKHISNIDKKIKEELRDSLVEDYKYLDFIIEELKVV